MRHDHTRRAAVFWREWLIVIFQGNKRLTVDNVGERHVGGIAAVAVGGYKHGVTVQLHMLEEGIEADTFPFHVEMCPLSDTGNVHYIGLHGKLKKLLPCPRCFFPDKTVNGECPSVERGPWSGSC